VLRSCSAYRRIRYFLIFSLHCNEKNINLSPDYKHMNSRGETGEGARPIIVIIAVVILLLSLVVAVVNIFTHI